MATCFPPLEIIKKFQVPLTAGEKYLLDKLMMYLDDSFEIFIQPFLNCDRPDFVLMRKNYGVLIIEVKDWNLALYSNPRGESYPWILSKDRQKIMITSPLEQVEKYKENLYNIHISQLFERTIKNKKNFSIVRTAVYFHNSCEKNANEFCYNKSPYIQVIGKDSLCEIAIKNLMMRVRLDSENLFNSSVFDNDLYQSFRRFLQPPDHVSSDGRDINYNSEQKEIIQSKAGDRRKIRGVAGSGKTQIIAARAVNAYQRTKKTVLILTFNITLRNYIHDRISDVKLDFPWNGFEINHYHGFFASQANNYNLPCKDILKCADNENFFERTEPHRYETIIIDEIQDYKETWLRLILKSFLEKNGELIVFGDEKQNIYNQPLDNEKYPRVPSIVGRWKNLKKSFRLNNETSYIAELFQQHYFNNRYNIDSKIEHKQRDLLEESSHIKYYKEINCSPMEQFKIIHREIIQLNLHPNDIVILASTHEVIREVEYCFRQITKEKTMHAGETKEEHEQHGQSIKDIESIRRVRKLHFWGNSGNTKFSTIHSFKGWEASTIILIIGKMDNENDLSNSDELIYVALTRAKKNLIVINTAQSKYNDFFEKIAKKKESDDKNYSDHLIQRKSTIETSEKYTYKIGVVEYKNLKERLAYVAFNINDGVTLYYKEFQEAAFLEMGKVIKITFDYKGNVLGFVLCETEDFGDFCKKINGFVISKPVGRDFGFLESINNEQVFINPNLVKKAPCDKNNLFLSCLAIRSIDNNGNPSWKALRWLNS